MYIEKTTRYGNVIEIEKHHTSKYRKPGEKRRKKEKPTSEAVEANNLKKMKHWLFMLLVCNFVMGDHHVVLTYSDDNLPEQELAKKYLQKFLRQMRNAYKKRDRELKWICTTEISKRGRIHHHIVMNDCPDFSKLLAEFWPYGGKHLTPMYKDNDYQGLADYLVKSTSDSFDDEGSSFRKRYTCSRNLAKPEVTTRVIGSGEWRKKPRVSEKQKEEGWCIMDRSIVVGSDIFGYPYQKYQMVRMEPKKKRRFKT